MTNVLEGIEYRTLNPALPSWNTNVYTDWQDAAGLTTFPSGALFRVKPKFDYVVESRTDENVQATVELRTPSKDNAMKKVAQLVEEGKAVRLEKHEIPTFTVGAYLSDKNVQFKLAGQDKWTHVQYLNFNALGVSSRIEFRIRPDLYWEVTISGAVSKSLLTFDDFDAMHKYVDNKLRTSDFDISIRKVRYAG